MPAVLSDAARRFLEEARLAHLATADAAARPHVIPLCYALERDEIVFVVDEKPKAGGKTLKRLRNLAENPRIALVVDRWDEDWSRLEYVLVVGDARIVDDPGAYARAVERLRARYPQYRAMTLTQARNPVVHITLRTAHHWRASPSDD